MKSYFISIPCFLLFCFLLFACNNDEKLARIQLQQAQELYESGEYGSAKQVLSNLKITFPREVKVQKENLQLMRKIDLKQQERNLAYCDSALLVLSTQIDSLKTYFLWDKNEYDESGKYVDKSWNPNLDLGRPHVKIQVNQWGEMALTSVYSGKSAIEHSYLKVTSPNGYYTQTASIPKDGSLNYSFVDDNWGTVYEIVTFQKEIGNGIIQFIAENQQEKLTIQFIGTKRFTSTISTKEKEAIARSFEFADLLASQKELKSGKEKAEKRIKYLKGL